MVFQRFKKKIFFISFLTLTLAFLACQTKAYCQENEIFFSNFSSGYGARALGMGGAFLAVSDDSSASSWNPAGLINISKPQISFSFAYDRLKRNIPEYEYSGPSYGFPTQYSVSRIDTKFFGKYFDFFSLTYPLKILGHQLVSQLSYQRKIPFSLTTESDYSLDYKRFSDGNIAYEYFYDYKYKSTGAKGFDVFSFTVATEFSQIFKAGISINKWFNGYSIGIEESYSGYTYKYDEIYWDELYKDKIDIDISGISIDFGVLIIVSEKVNLGIVWKSGFEADINYSNLAEYTTEQENYSFHQEGATSGKGKIVFPSSAGIGVSFYPINNLLFSLDFMRTNWASSKIKNYSRANSAGGVSAEQELRYPSFKIPGKYEQLDSKQLKFGTEYKLKIKGITFPLRFGIFKDFQYCVDSKNDQIGYWGFSLGSGFHFWNFFFDVAFVNERGIYYYARDQGPEYKEVKSNFMSLFTSLTYKF